MISYIDQLIFIPPQVCQLFNITFPLAFITIEIIIIILIKMQNKLTIKTNTISVPNFYSQQCDVKAFFNIVFEFFC